MASTVTQSVTSFASPIWFASALVHTCGRVINIYVHEQERMMMSFLCGKMMSWHEPGFPHFCLSSASMHYCEYKGFKNWFGHKGNWTVHETYMYLPAGLDVMQSCALCPCITATVYTRLVTDNYSLSLMNNYCYVYVAIPTCTIFCWCCMQPAECCASLHK